MITVSPGTRISEYILDRPLGAGAFAEVWLAHHHIWTDSQVAVKLARDESYIQYLKREGILLHKLEHPHIVRTLGLDPTHDPPYMIAEYVSGGSLRDLLKKKGRLTPPRALEVVEEALEGLAFAHENGVIHQDLKPENILLGTDGVKLSDFGLGKATSEITLSSVFRSEGGQAGTPLYFSPEQKQGEEVDARSDLYAMGLIFFECLTGSLPAGPEMPSEIVESLPSEFDEFYRKLCARKEKRFPSAEEALRAMDELWRAIGFEEKVDPGPEAIAPGAKPIEPAGSMTAAEPFIMPPSGPPWWPEEETGDAADKPTAPDSRSRGVWKTQEAAFLDKVTPAGFGVRCFAHVIDFAILYVVLLSIFQDEEALWIALPVCHFFYTIVMTAVWDGTIGKRLLRLRVKSADGTHPDFFQSFWRYLFAVATLGISFFVSVFDRRKRGIHDYVANTVVIWN